MLISCMFDWSVATNTLSLRESNCYISLNLSHADFHFWQTTPSNVFMFPWKQSLTFHSNEISSSVSKQKWEEYHSLTSVSVAFSIVKVKVKFWNYFQIFLFFCIDIVPRFLGWGEDIHLHVRHLHQKCLKCF